MNIRKQTVKTLSLILSVVMTIHAGTALISSSTNAADENLPGDERNAGTLSISGGSVSLGSLGSYAAPFVLEKSGGRYHIYNEMYSDESNEAYLDNITSLSISGYSSLNIKTDVEADLSIYEYASMTIAEGCTCTCNVISGMRGSLSINGTLKMAAFTVASYDSETNIVSITNNGTISAQMIDLQDGTYFTSGSSAVYEASRTFQKGEEDLAGEVIATSANTLISSRGGSFKLTLGSISKTIEGEVSDIAGNMIMEYTSVSFTITPDSAKTVYIGQDYDFSPYITVTPDSYTGTPFVEYADPQAADSTYYAPDNRPTTPGTYNARANVPSVPGYYGSVSEPQAFEIKYLPNTEVSSTGNYYSLTGVVNGVYVPGNVTVVPANGFKIKQNTANTAFADSIVLGHDDVFDGNGNARTFQFAYKRNSDGAETEYITAGTATPGFADLIFDEYDPSIYNEAILMPDEEGAEMMLETSIEDGGTIVGDKLTFSVYDENLSTVTIDGRTYTESDFEDGNIEITLSVAIGTAKTYTLVATDKADKELSLSFTLQHTTVEASVASITQDDVYVGDEYQPRVNTDSDGEVSLFYKDNNDADAEFVATKPTSAGDYTVEALIAETDFYFETSCSTTFKIKKRTPVSSVRVPDTIIGEEYAPEFTSDSDSKGRVVFEYKPSNATDRSYTTTMPTAKGTYTVRATTPETDKYLAGVCTYTFTISVKPVTATVSVEDPFVGTKYSPVVTTDSDGASKTKFEYRPANSVDGEYTTEQPTSAGTYIVRATVPETDTYASAVCTYQFNIKYLTAPANAYNMEGTAGNNDFFTSDVELTAPAGYMISSEFGGEYKDKIPYSDDLEAVYLMRTEDGALTSAVALSVRPKIDKATPTFEDSTGTLTNGSSVFVKSLTLRASDDNLASLSVNGVDVDLDAEGNIMTLSPGYGIKYFKIVAEDKAGNISIIEFTLMAEWLESRIILPDIKLPLTKGEYYNLDSGRWTVTSGSGEEDKTVYNGNLPIYVNNSGDYTFTKVS